jgi:hypothetical protein
MFSRSASFLEKPFSDSAPSTPARISPLAGDCVAEDPEKRQAVAAIALDVSWVRTVGDSVLAYIDSLTVCTPREESAQESKFASTRSCAVILSGESHQDYVRYEKELEVIFATFFPEWTDRSYPCKVLPLAEIPRTTITRRWRNWEKNHDWRPWNTQAAISSRSFLS